MFDQFFLIAVSTVVTIVNPFGAVGPFLAMTAGDDDIDLTRRRKIALRASIVAAIVLLICAALGSFIFKFFGITIPALKISGGILLFLVAIDMLNARNSNLKSNKEEQDEGAMREQVAVFPIAIPLLAGPGAIGSVFMLMDQAESLPKQASVYAAILISMGFSYLVLREAHRISRLLGRIGMNVLTRLMGLILASIAAQFIIDGIAGAMKSIRFGG